MKLTVSKITATENNSFCVTLKQCKTSVLGTQKVKDATAYIYFSLILPTYAEGEELDITLSDFEQEDHSWTNADGDECHVIRLWEK